MTHITHILMAVGAGGALGAVFRFIMTAWVHRFAPAAFPWGTFLVNMTGCMFLGVALRLMEGAPPTSAWRAFLTVGLAGAFTTFSTFSHETLLLLQNREYGRAALYTSGSVVLGALGLLLGLALASPFVQRG